MGGSYHGAAQCEMESRVIPGIGSLASTGHVKSSKKNSPEADPPRNEEFSDKRHKEHKK